MKMGLDRSRCASFPVIFSSNPLGIAVNMHTRPPGGRNAETAHWGKPTPAKDEVYDDVSQMESMAGD
jgi:hypothetical protein